MKSIKVKLNTTYGGHNVNNNGIVNLNLVCSYDELTNVIQLLQLLNTDINVFSKNGNKTDKLGVFTLKNISINNNGESKIKLSSLIDAVNLEYVNVIIDKEIAKICFVSEIENESGDEEE